MNCDNLKSAGKFICNNLYFILLLLFPLAGIIIYMWTFRQCPNGWYFDCISSDPANWGQFGDYFNWIIGFVNLVLLIKLTQIANDLGKKSLEKELTFEIYKNFLAKIDKYVDEYKQALKDGNNVSVRLSQASIVDLTNSAKEDFSQFFDAIELTEFKTLCNYVANQYGKVEESNTKEFFNNVSKIRTFLYKQVKK